MTFRIEAPGIFTDIAAADYFADPCDCPSLTQSIAKILLERSPAHARLEHPRLHPITSDDDEPQKYVKAKIIGDAAHSILIGRGKEFAIGEFDNWMTKDAKAFKADAIADGRTPILDKHLAQARALAATTRMQLAGTELGDPFEWGHGEVVIASCEDGTWLRALVDWMVDPRELVDLKTSALSCAPHAVEDRPSVMGWDLQAAMQERILDAVDPEGAGRRRFHFIAQENEPPFALTVVRISEHDMTMGRKKIAMAIDIWRRCMERGEWPAYAPETVLSRPRPWMESQFLEREVAYDDRQQQRRSREPMLTDLAGG